MYQASTFAYDWYVDDDFIKPFKKYLPMQLYNDYDSEIKLHNAMCKVTAERIKPLFNFDDILNKYVKKLYTSSPKDLNEQQMDKILTTERKKLESYAKLSVCLNLMKNDNYEIDVLNDCTIN